MKNLIITLCLLACIQLGAQTQNQIAPQLSKKENGIWLEFESTKQTAAIELAQNKAAFQLGANDELSPVNIQEDQLGYRHHRYQQTYKGIPVEDAIFILHEKNNRVAKANGNLISGLNIPTTPAISEAAALQSALQHTNAAEYAWQNVTYENLIKDIKNNPNATLYPKGELVIVNAGQRQKTTDYKLSYKFDIYALEPETRQYVYIDAQTCEVLMAEERMHNCTDPAFGVTNYSQVVNFTACEDNNAGQYILKNTIGGGGMQVFDAMNTDNTPLIPFTDADNFFDSTPTANEVHWAVEKTRDYYLAEHNRQGIDDNNMPICSWIRYQRASGNRNNAYWNGMFLQFGDGDGVNYTSFTSPDIVAHEYTHGITDYTANLRYHHEHGALNESFSDIFGEVAERYMRGTNDWIIGADFVVNPNFNGIRNMSNPKDATMIKQQPDTYLGTNWHTGFNDNGGVHTNSGVQNYWFYLLAEGGSGVNDNGDTYNVSGIGVDKATDIAYRNLAVYLTSDSEYADARAGAIQAAEDLYGTGSNEALQTAAAWCAVGVGDCGMNPISCRYTDSLALVALYNATNGTNWMNTWNLNQPMDTWYSVGLNENGCVSSIDLGGNNLTGNIPPEIGDLNSLTTLGLFLNQLGGELPPELGNLNNLKNLWLVYNQFSGCYDANLMSLCSQLFTSTNNNISNSNNFNAPWEDFCNSGAGVCGNPPNCRYSDSLALVALYNSTNGASWTTTWDLNAPIDSWYGVYLNGFGCVRALGLINNQIAGFLPSEIGSLTSLRWMDFSINQLTGSIPSEIGNLINLEGLDLAYNQFSGDIPPEIWNLNNLRTLWLHINQLTGSIPPQVENLTNLGSLYLSGNQLSGSIPPEIGNLNKLTSLWLQGNEFTGSIPPQIENLTNLTILYLSGNQLSGSIPPEISNLSNLTQLRLYNNQLSSCYHPDLINICSQLDSTYNTNNKISNGNNFDAPWEDFCNTGAGNCYNEIVHPGDFNNDGTANATDILYWGLAAGSIGFPRSLITNNWAPQDAYWWEAVHEDGNGDGTVDFDDIAVLVQNYGFTYLPIPSSTPNQGLINYELRLENITQQPRRLHFGLYATSKTGVAVSTHGLTGVVDFNLLDEMKEAIAPEMDTTGSALEPVADFTHYDYAGKQLHFALTRTDKNNHLLGIAPIATFIVTVDDLKVGEEVEYAISANSGSLMNANGSAVPVGATTLAVTISNSNGGVGDVIGYVTTSDEQCNLPGWAKAEIQGGTAPYTYQWSNGENIQTINNLAAGNYTVTINDALGNILILSSEINPPDPIYDDYGNQILCDNSVCPLNLPLSGIISSATYRASNTVTATGIIPQGGNVSCTSAGEVIMEAGFSVGDNANFSAEIEDCGGY